MASLQASSIKYPSCKICFEDFYHEKRKPYCVHPCAHTFCLECLNKLDTKSCPIYRQVIEGKNPNWGILEFFPVAKNPCTTNVKSTTSLTGRHLINYKDISKCFFLFDIVTMVENRILLKSFLL